MNFDLGHPIHILKSHYENKISELLGIKIKILIEIKKNRNYFDENRCLARIIDKDPTYPDINKRCCNSVMDGLPLCKPLVSTSITVPASPVTVISE